MRSYRESVEGSSQGGQELQVNRGDLAEGVLAALIFNADHDLYKSALRHGLEQGRAWRVGQGVLMMTGVQADSRRRDRVAAADRSANSSRYLPQCLADQFRQLRHPVVNVRPQINAHNSALALA